MPDTFDRLQTALANRSTNTRRVRSSGVVTVYLLPLLLAIGVTSCSDGVVEPEPEATGLLGSWQRLSSCGGFGPQCGTPASTGYDQTIVMTMDSVFQWFRADSLFFQRDFSVTRDETMYGIQDVIVLEQQLAFAFDFPSKDSLRLRDLCYDCFEHRFLRLR